MSQVTLKDVAVHAGVSHQTVSNVLNDHPHIRPLMRERVLAAIAALDYHPNQAAKALREARITTLCCVFHNHDAEQIGDPYRNMIQSAFVAEANAHGYSISIAFLHSNQPETFAGLRQRYRQQQFGGAVVVGGNLSAAEWQEIQSWGLKGVLFDTCMEAVDADTVGNSSVCADYCAGMGELVAHHVSRGRRELALIIPQDDSNSTAIDRRKQFLDSVRQHGVRGRLMHGDWSFEAGKAAAQEILQGRQRPDAILGGNDRMAAGALRAAHELGLSIPGDVAISGFDDFDFTQYTTPPLTTVQVPHGLMAREAVRLLLRLIETGEEQPRKVFPTTLIVRDSS